jgi:hypothetical protein
MIDKDEAARLRVKALARWEGEGGALGRSDVAIDEEEVPSEVAARAIRRRGMNQRQKDKAAQRHR